MWDRLWSPSTTQLEGQEIPVLITAAAVAHLSHPILIQQIRNVFILAQTEMHNQELKSQVWPVLQAGLAEEKEIWRYKFSFFLLLQKFCTNEQHHVLRSESLFLIHLPHPKLVCNSDTLIWKLPALSKCGYTNGFNNKLWQSAPTDHK